jgi:hypothetical protein
MAWHMEQFVPAAAAQSVTASCGPKHYRLAWRLDYRSGKEGFTPLMQGGMPVHVVANTHSCDSFNMQTLPAISVRLRM